MKLVITGGETFDDYEESIHSMIFTDIIEKLQRSGTTGTSVWKIYKNLVEYVISCYMITGQSLDILNNTIMIICNLRITFHYYSDNNC